MYLPAAGERDFLWPVAAAGYAVISGRRAAEDDIPVGDAVPFLADAEGGAPAVRHYAPLADAPGLFRELADLTDADAVRRFADRRGRLSTERLTDFVPADGGPTRPGDPVAEWQHEAAALRHAVLAWDAVRVGDPAPVAGLVRWLNEHEDGGPAVVFDPPPADVVQVRPEMFRRVRPVRVIASPDVCPDLFRAMRPGDLLGPARVFLQRTLDARLAAHAVGGATLDPADGRIAVRLAPRSLLGAAWVQLAGAVGRGAEFRRCDGCGDWVEVPPTAAHAARVYCSNACKTRAYRGRKAAAARLHAAGKSAAEIAAELGVDVGSVGRWLGDRPSGR